MTKHLRQIHDACGKLVLYHIVMMFLLKGRRDDHYNLISSFTELQIYHLCFQSRPLLKHFSIRIVRSFVHTKPVNPLILLQPFRVKKCLLVGTGVYYHHTVSRTRSRSRPRI